MSTSFAWCCVIIVGQNAMTSRSNNIYSAPFCPPHSWWRLADLACQSSSRLIVIFRTLRYDHVVDSCFFALTNTLSRDFASSTTTLSSLLCPAISPIIAVYDTSGAWLLTSTSHTMTTYASSHRYDVPNTSQSETSARHHSIRPIYHATRVQSSVCLNFLPPSRKSYQLLTVDCWLSRMS